MTDMMRIVTIGALLHDIGKAIIRASGERKTHSQLGADFLRPFCDISEAGEAVVRCVRYHHGRDLSGAHLSPDDLAYIVYEADNLAAGIDRRDRDDGTAAFGFDPELTLENVFNVFDGVKRKSYFPLQSLNAALPMNMPVADRPLASRGKYAGIVKTLSANFKEMPPQEMKGNELLRILEDTLSYVPSSTAKGEVCDISLFDHVKITAAVASSLLRYMQQHGIADYKNFCYTRGLENRKKDTLLFISADFSGIQKFIYRVQTKGAMRMLRGRSFYLAMVMEHIIDEILEKLSLSRANLIYSGGGHFYMMADNSEETKKILEEAFRSVNDRLLHDYGTSLYVAAGWVPFSAEELLPGREKKDNIFRRVNRVIAEKKQSRYSAEAIAQMIDEDSALNTIEPGMRECALCHRSLDASQLKDYAVPGKEDEKIQVCPACNGMYLLGKDIIDAKSADFAILHAPIEGALPLPSPFGAKYLKAVMTEEEWKLEKKGLLYRVYARNASATSSLIGTRLWVGDYAAKEGGNTLDFGDLAKRSGGKEEDTGIDRLGVLRADVDWLGAVFAAGLPTQYATFSRYAALSRSLSMFFTKGIVDICEKKLPAGEKPFYLFGEKEGNRLVHIVYSGGDDLFLVGAWDDLLELAVDLRKAFATYTNGMLSFSAGLGLFSPSYPVIRMAEDTGELEDMAKKEPEKDSVALFGESETAAPVFTWEELEKEVAGEKLHFLLQHMILTGINDTEAPQGRCPAGKSLLYRLLELLVKRPFNLARFAYALARLEPVGKAITAEEKANYEDIRKNLFQWGRSSGKERLKVETALRLVIYRMREKEK